MKEEPDSATQNAVVHIPGRGPAEREKDAHGARGIVDMRGACTMTLTNESCKYPGMGVKGRSCRT